jgi:hypothetical protein
VCPVDLAVRGGDVVVARPALGEGAGRGDHAALEVAEGDDAAAVVRVAEAGAHPRVPQSDRRDA